jgi:predicted enzyme related to lactoylglutathione lyase
VGKREGYRPGTFCSVDLATTDSEGAKAFYRGLFGWEGEDVHPGEGMTYTILRLGGDAVGGLFERKGLEEAGGPHWISYVSVESADDVARRAAELGGEAVEEPFDILDVGRMTAVKDPTGSGVAVWQPGTYAGSQCVNEPGFLTWNELVTNDTSAALRFYEGLFGWSSEAMDTGGGPEYTVIRVGDRTNGGVRRLSPEEEQAGVAPHWVPYFAVESLDAAIARCTDLGGVKLAGPIEMPAGRIAALRDPQGAMFSIWEGELED